MTPPLRAEALPLIDGPGAPASARHALRALLGGWGAPEALVEDACVVTSELVTNALLHGGGVRRVDVVLLGDRLRLAVADSGEGSPVPARHGAEASTGRGLDLVSALGRWGAAAEPGGKVVWAELAVPPAALDAPVEGGPEREGLARQPQHGVVVRLLDVPVEAHLALEAQDDAVQREVELLRVRATEGGAAPVPASLLGLCRELRARAEAPNARFRAAVAAAADRGEERVDLEAQVPPGDESAFVDHVALVEAIETYAEDGALLIDPPTAAVVLLRRWVAEQVVAQVRGAAPTPPPPLLARPHG